MLLEFFVLKLFISIILLQAERMSPLYNEKSEPQGSPCGHAGTDCKQ